MAREQRPVAPGANGAGRDPRRDADSCTIPSSANVGERRGRDLKTADREIRGFALVASTSLAWLIPASAASLLSRPQVLSPTIQVVATYPCSQAAPSFQLAELSP